MFTGLLRVTCLQNSPLCVIGGGKGWIVVYLDDGLGAASELKAAALVELCGQLQAGFVFNREKSIWKPLQWLGFVIMEQIEVPHEKITKLLDLQHVSR